MENNVLLVCDGCGFVEQIPVEDYEDCPFLCESCVIKEDMPGQLASLRRMVDSPAPVYPLADVLLVNEGFHGLILSLARFLKQSWEVTVAAFVSWVPLLVMLLIRMLG